MGKKFLNDRTNEEHNDVLWYTLKKIDGTAFYYKEKRCVIAAWMHGEKLYMMHVAAPMQFQPA